jgi:hypothetical protein
MKRPAISRAELDAMLVRRRQRLDEAKAEEELRNLSLTSPIRALVRI